MDHMLWHATINNVCFVNIEWGFNQMPSQIRWQIYLLGFCLLRGFNILKVTFPVTIAIFQVIDLLLTMLCTMIQRQQECLTDSLPPSNLTFPPKIFYRVRGCDDLVMEMAWSIRRGPCICNSAPLPQVYTVIYCEKDCVQVCLPVGNGTNVFMPCSL